MTKTIEEAAKEYYLNEVVNGDTCDDKDGWTDCFVRGAQAFMQLSLRDRLTAEEKERVRKIYYDAERGEVNGHYDVYPDPCEVMRVIFGKDFFKEGE